MKLRKTVRKIVALGTGAVMMGATMFGAMAADLANYPSPLFIKDGVFDGLLVVGDNAAAEDIIGVANIATSLQAASVVKKTVSTGGTTVSVTGDAFKLGTTSNMLEIGEALNAVGVTAIGSNELSSLAKGTVSNDKGDFDYNQDITLPTSTVTFYKDTDQSDDPELYLKFTGSADAYVYKLTFTPSWESDEDASDNLDDIKDKKITLFGKEYTILQAKNTTSSIYLTFFSGAVTDIVSEGATKTYTVKGKDYEVTPSYIGATEVLFTINTEVTDKMVEGGTYKLSDGTEIGVTNILAQNVAGETGGDKVEFSLGAEKIKILDTAPGNDNYGGTVTLGSTDVYQLGADISATSTIAGVTKISQIRVKYQPSSDIYVPVDGTLDAAATDEEDQTGNMFLNGFDFEFKGLSTGNSEVIKVKSSDSYNYVLDFYNRNNDHYKVDVWGWDATGAMFGKADFAGSNDRALVLNESVAITDEDYFILSPSASRKTHFMRYKSINTNTGTVKIKDLMDGGGTTEVSYNGSFNLDGTTFLLNVVGSDIYVDLDGNGTIMSLPGAGNDTTVVNRVYTRFSGDEGYIELTNVSLGKFVTEQGENKPTTNGQEVGNWSFAYATADQKYGLVEGAVRGGTLGTPQKLEDKDVYVAYDYWGTYYYVDYTDSKQPELTITYPDQQANALVYITSGATTSSAATTGTVTTDEVQEIGVAAVKLASEVSTPGNHNLILVGGPCANSVARSVMGVTSANCAEGFEAGKAKIKLYEHATGKVAMVVAGAGAVDTRRAAHVVASYKDYASDLVGDEVVVTTVTSTPTVAQPVVATATNTSA